MADHFLFIHQRTLYWRESHSTFWWFLCNFTVNVYRSLTSVIVFVSFCCSFRESANKRALRYIKIRNWMRSWPFMLFAQNWTVFLIDVPVAETKLTHRVQQNLREKQEKRAKYLTKLHETHLCVTKKTQADTNFLSKYIIRCKSRQIEWLWFWWMIRIRLTYLTSIGFLFFGFWWIVFIGSRMPNGGRQKWRRWSVDVVYVPTSVDGRKIRSFTVMAKIVRLPCIRHAMAS